MEAFNDSCSSFGSDDVALELAETGGTVEGNTSARDMMVMIRVVSLSFTLHSINN